MKKFAIATEAGAREVNANEYSVAPKTNVFSAVVFGDVGFAAATSGKGKSAEPNYYLYFRSEGVLYYFRSTAVEVEAAKKMFVVDAPGELARLGESEKLGTTGEPAPVPEVPKRTRVKGAKAKTEVVAA